MSDSESDRSSVTEDSRESKRQKTDAKKVVVSNKKVDPKSVPSKPAGPLKTGLSGSKSFFFKMIFTNGSLLRKFLEPVAHSVKKIRFILVKSPEFTGFRMEAHDAYFTLANKSRFECDIEAGTGIHGSKLTDDEINKYVFCVRAKSFMEALTASALKETTLSICRYHNNQDHITFESINNENDIRTVYTCSMVENSEVESLDSIKIQLGFHVNINLGTLKELSLNAKRCGALTVKFDLFQAKDTSDPEIIHSKMSIGFEGEETSGSTDFYLSTKKVTKVTDGKTVHIWEPLPGLSMTNQEGLTLEKKCSNEYDNSKLRLFLNHMECQWVLVHLGNDNTQQPLVLDCVLGGRNTKHTIIVAPKETSAS